MMSSTQESTSTSSRVRTVSGGGMGVSMHSPGSTPVTAPSKRRIGGEGRPSGRLGQQSSGLNGLRGGGGSQPSLSSEGVHQSQGRQFQQGAGVLSYSKVAKGVGNTGVKANGIHSTANLNKQAGQGQGQRQRQQTSTNERMLHASVCSVGCKAKVQVRSGCMYEGVVSTLVSCPEEEGCSLKVCSMTRGQGGLKQECKKQPPESEQVFNGKDLVMVEVYDVDMDGIVSDSGQLATDAAISGNTATENNNRVLQPWIDSSADAASDNLEALESLENNGYRQGSFDQFAVNQKRFGINATFKEEEYTTKLDKSKCKISEEDAQRIADDIIKGSANGIGRNVHLAEERGEDFDDSDIDEEEKYSSVARVPNNSNNVISNNSSNIITVDQSGKIAVHYRPPHARSNQKLNSNQESQQKQEDGGSNYNSYNQNVSKEERNIKIFENRVTRTKVIPIPSSPEDSPDIKQFKMVSQYMRTGTKTVKSPMPTPGQMSPLQDSPMMKFMNQYNLDIGSGPEVDPKIKKEFIQWKMKKEPENLKKQINDLKEFSKQPLKLPHDSEGEKSGLTFALNKDNSVDNGNIAHIHNAQQEIANKDNDNQVQQQLNESQQQQQQQSSQQQQLQSQFEVQLQQQTSQQQEPPQQDQQNQSQERSSLAEQDTREIVGIHAQTDKNASMHAESNDHTQLKSSAIETGAQTDIEVTNGQQQGQQLQQQSGLNPDAKEFTLNPTAREFVPFGPATGTTAAPSQNIPEYIPPAAPTFQKFQPHPHIRSPSTGSSPGSQTPTSMERPEIFYQSHPPQGQKYQPPFPYNGPAPAPYPQPSPAAHYPHAYPYMPMPGQVPHMPSPQQFVNGRPPQMAGYPHPHPHPHPQAHPYPMYPMQQMPQGQFPPQMPLPMGHYVPPGMMPGGPMPMGMPPPGYMPAMPVGQGQAQGQAPTPYITSQGASGGMMPAPVMTQQQQQMQMGGMTAQYPQNSPRPQQGEMIQGQGQPTPPPPPPAQMRMQQQPQPSPSQQQFESPVVSQQYFGHS